MDMRAPVFGKANSCAILSCFLRDALLNPCGLRRLHLGPLDAVALGCSFLNCQMTYHVLGEGTVFFLQLRLGSCWAHDRDAAPSWTRRGILATRRA